MPEALSQSPSSEVPSFAWRTCREWSFPVQNPEEKSPVREMVCGIRSFPTCAHLPSRLIPLDICNEFRAKGLIGALDDEYYVTVGNLTPVARCEQFAIEMSARLQEKGVTGVILTSS